ncbi:MAG TPA: alpha/beta hydrolase family protein [Planctomycetota bacterium]|nr:alpha/beta hydrolase family protein [Planctomycetota bacterium]
MNRNLSVQNRFRALAAVTPPKYRFAGKTPDDWKSWREQLLPELMVALGDRPHKVPLNPEILAEWTDDGLVKQKVLFDVEEGLSATAYVFRPEKAKGKLPGILACHGHGPYGKEAVMGNRSDPGLAANVEAHNYDYGLQMAKAGYAVIAIDWRGFGERDERGKYHAHNVVGQRDICNVYYVQATLLGMTVLGLDVHDGMRALDYFCGLDFVDADRIGVMGLSFGGTMTTWMSICDERIRAADIICYSDRFDEFALRDANTCGSQIVPGLRALCDLPDLHGLIAPRPLLVEIGTFDTCFYLDAALSCYHEVEKIYAAAGAGDKLELDLFEGPHAWGANKSFDFFRKHL